MIIIGIVIVSLMMLSNFFCGPPSIMRIVGFDCNDLLYEDVNGWTYKLGDDRHFINVGKEKE